MLRHVSSASTIAAVIGLTLMGSGAAVAAGREAPIQTKGAPQAIISFDSESDSVQSVGLDPQALARLRQTNPGFAAFAELLIVYVPDQLAETSPVPVLGSYLIGSDSIRFTPRFPWTLELTYRARFNLAVFQGKYGARPGVAEPYLEIHFTPRPQRPVSKATVTHIYPSSSRLPANLLRMYIHFSDPMSAGHAYEHIHLIAEANGEISRPFLVLDQEMWDREHRRLTLLFDPGRIKRGLRSRADMGPPLIPGRRYHLVVDARMPDANGNPLASSYDKAFEATEPIRNLPDYRRWKVVVPGAGSIEPLRLILNQPMDHALLERMIKIYHCEAQCQTSSDSHVGLEKNGTSDRSLTAAVEGSGESARETGWVRVEGRIHISSDETEWRFIQESAWIAGYFRIIIDPTLEDPAGNNLTAVFDADLGEFGLNRVLDQGTKISRARNRTASNVVVIQFNLLLVSRPAESK